MIRDKFYANGAVTVVSLRTVLEPAITRTQIASVTTYSRAGTRDRLRTSTLYYSNTSSTMGAYRMRTRQESRPLGFFTIEKCELFLMLTPTKWGPPLEVALTPDRPRKK